MWKCEDCKRIFDEPVDVVYNVIPDLPYDNKEYAPGCPCCGSTEIDEVSEYLEDNT